MADGCTVGSGVVGNALGLRDGIMEGTRGADVGLGDGIEDGLTDGSEAVGRSVGLGDGITDGIEVGEGDGAYEGIKLGATVGASVSGHVIQIKVIDLGLPPPSADGRYTVHTSSMSGGVTLHSPVKSPKTATASLSPSRIQLSSKFSLSQYIRSLSSFVHNQWLFFAMPDSV